MLSLWFPGLHVVVVYAVVRSVFYKGMAAAVVESLRAGRAAGCESWLRENIAEHLGAAMVDRLEQGSITHAVRRADEMAAACELLGELGIPARIAAASRDWFEQLAQGERRFSLIVVAQLPHPCLSHHDHGKAPGRDGARAG
jgi:hypothetical protein